MRETHPGPLLTPCCSTRFMVILEWAGPAYLQYQVVDGFECDECGAEWGVMGVPRLGGHTRA